jgi:hypothetical protein
LALSLRAVIGVAVGVDVAGAALLRAIAAAERAVSGRPAVGVDVTGFADLIVPTLAHGAVAAGAAVCIDVAARRRDCR